MATYRYGNDNKNNNNNNCGNNDGCENKADVTERSKRVILQNGTTVSVLYWAFRVYTYHSLTSCLFLGLTLAPPPPPECDLKSLLLLFCTYVGDDDDCLDGG